jgi:hypothetical protein
MAKIKCKSKSAKRRQAELFNRRKVLGLNTTTSNMTNDHAVKAGFSAIYGQAVSNDFADMLYKERKGKERQERKKTTTRIAADSTGKKAEVTGYKCVRVRRRIEDTTRKSGYRYTTSIEDKPIYATVEIKMEKERKEFHKYTKAKQGVTIKNKGTKKRFAKS